MTTVDRASVALERRNVGRILITLLLAFLCLNAWIQTVMRLFGTNDDPAALVTWQLLSGAAAAVAAVGAWRLSRWAPAAATAYGLITGTMIIRLGPILDLDPAERSGLIVGAGAVLLTGAGIALYLRRLIRRSRRAVAGASM